MSLEWQIYFLFYFEKIDFFEFNYKKIICDSDFSLCCNKMNSKSFLTRHEPSNMLADKNFDIVINRLLSLLLWKKSQHELMRMSVISEIHQVTFFFLQCSLLFDLPFCIKGKDFRNERQPFFSVGHPYYRFVSYYLIFTKNCL